MIDYLINNNGGILFAVLGMAMATILAGIGSAKGVGFTGEAAAALTTEQPGKIWSSIDFTIITRYARVVRIRYRVLDFY